MVGVVAVAVAVGSSDRRRGGSKNVKEKNGFGLTSSFYC